VQQRHRFDLRIERQTVNEKASLDLSVLSAKLLSALAHPHSPLALGCERPHILDGDFTVRGD